MNRYLPLFLLLSTSAPAAAGPILSARPFRAAVVPFQAPPLSGFLKEIRALDGLHVLKTPLPGLETSQSLNYHEPAVEERRKTGPNSYYLEPTTFELRPGSDLKRDAALIKKALASLPKQIESVWPEWRDSVVEKVGLTVRENDREEWGGPVVFVDMISRKPLVDSYYEVVRLEKRGRRWVLAEPPKQGSGVILFTSALGHSKNGSAVPAKHALRDSDVVKDVRWLSRSLRGLLKVPRRYASHILRSLSLGVWLHESSGPAQLWTKAALTSNNPVNPGENRYEEVTLVKP